MTPTDRGICVYVRLGSIFKIKRINEFGSGCRSCGCDRIMLPFPLWLTRRFVIMDFRWDLRLGFQYPPRYCCFGLPDLLAVEDLGLLQFSAIILSPSLCCLLSLPAVILLARTSWRGGHTIFEPLWLLFLNLCGECSLLHGFKKGHTSACNRCDQGGLHDEKACH
eukprot:1156319-Pelagomonas_calceolata.AAC.1